ncbi:hypothetical protein GCM10023160_02510 [Brachybacterium paraconglomeratum]|uniref:DUF6973 domain-containing protein n=1 Tax=Brachybacterium paraconglomeratum TaxID=173362 RepID=UPI0031EFB884
MSFLGQDTDAVRTCADAFSRGGSAIAQLLAEITPRVMDESMWRGEDADQLRSTWQSGVLHDADRILADLGSRSRELETHADEQDGASSAGGDGGLGPGAVVGARLGTAGLGALGFGGLGAGFAPGLAAGFVSEDPDGDDGLGNDNGDDGSSPTGKQTDHSLTQEDADRIYKEYQVEDDETTMWELTGYKRWLAEKAGVSIPDPMEVTETEAELLDDLDPLEMKIFNDVKDQAFEEVAARYGDENGNDPHPGDAPFNDDQADAFRHAYINARNARLFGDDWATDFWTGHERIEGNDPAREAMDLHNNEVGRRIAREHPFATNGQLTDLVEQSVANGEMVVIDKSGRLVPSNSITPDEAGHPDPGAAPMPGHPQERQTS